MGRFDTPDAEFAAAFARGSLPLAPDHPPHHRGPISGFVPVAGTAIELLRSLPSMDGTFALVGGAVVDALRSEYHGVPFNPKDLDILCTTEAGVEVFRARLLAAGGVAGPERTSRGARDRHPAITYGGWTFDVFSAKATLRETLASFDFRACQVWFDGAVIHGLESAIDDIRAMSTLATRCVWKWRFDRMVAKGFAVDVSRYGWVPEAMEPEIPEFCLGAEQRDLRDYLRAKKRYDLLEQLEAVAWAPHQPPVMPTISFP